MYCAKGDRIMFLKDTRRTRDYLGSAVVDYQEIEGGHLTFIVGKNITYFKEDAMNLIRKYNPRI